MKKTILTVAITSLSILAVAPLAQRLAAANGNLESSGDVRVAQDDHAKSTPATTPAGLGSGDQAFLENASAAGQLEVVLGRLAEEHAASTPVKKFGKHVADDHSEACIEIEALAKKKGVVLEEKPVMDSTTNPPKVGPVPPNMDEDSKKAVERFTALTPGKFDSQYIEQMVKDHEKAVRDFEEASKSAADPDVKKLAMKTLPTLRDHLHMAKNLQKVTPEDVPALPPPGSPSSPKSRAPTIQGGGPASDPGAGSPTTAMPH